MIAHLKEGLPALQSELMPDGEMISLTVIWPR